MSTEGNGTELVRTLATRLANQGRWGPQDQVGTLNLITPEKVVRAARLVTRGRTFSLAVPFDANGPTGGVRGRFNPMHTMLATGLDALTGNQGPGGFGFADDMIVMPLQSGTQWDGLSHIFHDGEMYNGQSAALVTSNGAARNGIEQLSERVATRGVLLDVGRFRGKRGIEDGEALHRDELIATARAHRVDVEPGDAVLVRTGFMTKFLERGDWNGYATGPTPGLAMDVLEWMHERDVAAVATDTYRVEPFPNEVNGTRAPFHLVAVAHMGLLLGEVFYLDALASDCSADGVYDFFFVAPPLPITGAVGSPVNPYAIK
jgi:kynurenine formamidase